MAVVAMTTCGAWSINCLVVARSSESSANGTIRSSRRVQHGRAAAPQQRAELIRSPSRGDAYGESGERADGRLGGGSGSGLFSVHGSRPDLPIHSRMGASVPHPVAVP